MHPILSVVVTILRHPCQVNLACVQANAKILKLRTMNILGEKIHMTLLRDAEKAVDSTLIHDLQKKKKQKQNQNPLSTISLGRSIINLIKDINQKTRANAQKAFLLKLGISKQGDQCDFFSIRYCEVLASAKEKKSWKEKIYTFNRAVKMY